MKRNKLMLPILAVIVGVAASAFTTMSQKHTAKNANRAETYYFQFTGTIDQDEGNRTQWDLLPSQTAYDLINCPQGDFGCKLVATDTVMINSEAHPKEVYVQSKTNIPTTGAFVSQVVNKAAE